MEERDENLPFPRKLFKPLNGSGLREPNEITNLPNPRFRDGQVLPTQYRAQLLQEAGPCVPLEEIDPYYNGKQTFVVIGRWGTIQRFSANSRNHGTLDPSNTLRRLAIYLQTNWIFSGFIVATLLVNIFALVTTQSYEISKEIGGPSEKSSMVDIMYTVNDICMAVYCFELLVKLLARGLFGSSFSSCQDPWTWLDILVILTGFIPRDPLILTRQAAVWIRIFKIVPLVPSILQAGRISLRAVKDLTGMVFLNVLVLWFFALLGCQFYMGTLSQICIKKFPSGLEITDELWNAHNYNVTNWYIDIHMGCGNATGTKMCPEDYVCLQGYGKNPDDGYTNFDNIFWSLLSVIRIAAEDFTEEIYRQILSRNGPWNMVFFLLIFFFITYPMGCIFFAILGSFFTQKNSGSGEGESEELNGLAGGTPGEVITIRDTTGDEEISGENLTGIRKRFHNLIYHEWTRNILICVILMDIFAIASYYDGIEDNEFDRWVYDIVIPYIVLLVYTVEFLAKIICAGPLGYFWNGWHILDFVILVQCFLEIIHESAHYVDVICLLKLIQYWPSLRMIFAIYYKTLKSLWGWILYSCIVFAFLVFITPFELGQYERHPDLGRSINMDDIPRWSFVDFWRSFRLVVRMQIAEWIETLWEILPFAGSITFVYYLAVNLCGALLISFVMCGVAYSCVGELQNNYDPQMEKGLRLVFRKAMDCLPERIRLSGGTKRNGFGTLAMGGGGDDHQQTGHLRKRMQDFADHWAYNSACVALIIIASVTMTMETSESSGSKPTAALIIEILFTISFFLVAVFELLSYGLGECLVSRGWLLDALIVLENILNLSIHQYSLTSGFLVSLLWIRSFRPFMLVSRVAWLKAPYEGLKYQLKIIWETILAIWFIWLIFDTFAVHWLAGLYHKCVDPAIGKEMKLNRTECLQQNYTWENAEFHFDNAADGFINMVFLVSRMGWVSIINGGSDATSHGLSPEKDVNNMWLIYFILFMFSGGIGAMGILFAYVFNKFQVDRGYNLILTEKQASEYTEAQMKNFPNKSWITLEDEWIPEPQNNCRRSLYRFVTNWKFDAFVMLVIFIDNFCLSLDHYEASPSFTMVMFHLFLILSLYTAEMILKIVAWGPNYFRSGWNILDMIIVVSGIADFLLSEVSAKYFVSSSLLRMLRILRIFRLLLADKWGSKTAKHFIGAVISARHALGNLLLLQAVIMWTFAILGMYLFGNLKETWAVDDYVNFRTVPSAFATLALLFGFPCLDGFYVSLSNTEDCDVEKGTCGNRTWAVFYIGLYAGATFWVLLNMYAVLITEIIAQIESDSSRDEVACGDRDNGKGEVLEEVKPESGTAEATTTRNGEFVKFDSDSDDDTEQ